LDSFIIEYNSRDTFYKDPFGAVEPGTKVHFRIVASSDEKQTEASLELSGPDFRASIPMQATAAEGGKVHYSAEFSPSKAGLVWYWFSVKVNGKDHFVGALEGEGGPGRTVLHHPRPFQLTVYERQRMPSWAGDGAFYQIFVDRFRKSGVGIPQLRKGALLHASWDDTPFYVRACKDGSIKRWTFFGGDLAGVEEKLPYLWELGVNAIYLNPIFESPSSHKYDTADYSRIDPGFGDEGSLRRLCEQASEWGIKVILDGVFSHTGSDSVYFNKEGTYEGPGAYQSPSSPYYSWYTFKDYPEEYECWWGFKGLPNVNELNPSYLDFMVEGRDSIVRKWMRSGISGWRLDVADELPGEFIQRLRKVVKEENPDAILIGEVWDDASNKVSYSVRREYLLGRELDSVTGYPLREAIINFATGKSDARSFVSSFMRLAENYPPDHLRTNLNILGSHDVTRVLTALGDAPDESSLGQEAKESYRLPEANLAIAKKRLMLAGMLQFLLPGIPMVYYGDEAGMQGYSDPYNRGAYPWGKEDRELLSWFKHLGEARAAHRALKSGETRILESKSPSPALAFLRRSGQDVVLAVVNPSGEQVALKLDVSFLGCGEALFQDLFFGPGTLVSREGVLELTVPAVSALGYSCTLQSKPLFGRLPMERCAGVLLHISSLPSPYGIGDFGPEAHRFAELLAKSGQRIWQVLPMNPPSLGNSPYMCFSAMAGNPLFISPELLEREGLLTEHEAGVRPCFDEDRVDFEAVSAYKHSLFRAAYRRFMESHDKSGFEEFRRRNSGWLHDYSLFMVIKGLYGGRPWQDWPDELKSRDPEALSRLFEENADECRYHDFLQYLYDRQWKSLKAHANSLGLSLVGDMAIYVSGDSSDVWANKDMFYLAKDGSPKLVSGVPPDSFSATGQLWGHPVYRWDRLAADGYGWWKARMDKSFEDFDYTRIDHFRGFAGYYAVPGGNATAEHGRWLEGPGLALFEAVAEGRGGLPIIVEDLGVITPDVVDLRQALGFPGMKVLQFMDWVPSRSKSDDAHWVAYTGTHDNETLLQRYRTIKGIDQNKGEADGEEAAFVDRMLNSLYDSPYSWAIAPLQDLLCLGAEARMNTPSVAEGNWGWRARRDMLGEELSERMLALAKAGGRCE